jgi:tripartite ATP-independent transporter DctP family solute receptor
MKRAFIGILLVAMVLSLALGSGGCAKKEAETETPEKQVEEEKILIKMGHVEPTASGLHEAALKFKSLVEERSNGRVEVQVFPHSELGSGTEMGEMTQAGALQMAVLPVGHIGGLCQELQILDIPFLLPIDPELAEDIMNGPAGDKLSSTLEKAGLVGLGFWNVGLKQYTANKPLRSPSDFKGLKMRTMPSPLIVESFKVLGSSPTPIAYMELYTALQLGTVEGQENPIWAIADMKFYEVQKYLTISNHGAFEEAMVANPEWFNSLSEDIREIIIDAEKEAGRHCFEATQRLDTEKLQEIVDYGVEVIRLTPEEGEAFKEALKPVRDKYVELVGQSGADLLKAFDG